MKKINKEVIDAIIKDRNVRRKVTRESLWLFFLVYFAHYIKHELANLHEEIIDIIQDEKNKLICITAFRGSGKSTIITTASAIWSTLGIQQKKFVLIVCQTKAQAKVHMTNLKVELEENDLLKSDLGPFQEDIDQEWNAYSVVFSNSKARVTIASLEQSVRGIRHRQTRPDLIILDDIEDSQSVKTLDSRDKTFNWFTSEIIPLGDLETRIIIVGNIIHEDSMVVRLRNKIQKGETVGIYREYPLINDQGECLWPGKFPTPESLEDFKKTIINPISWQREYLLKVVPDEYQVVHRDYIKYYDELPSNTRHYSCIIVGVDPAVSEKDKADYSAIVSGLIVYNHDTDESNLYILPNITNERLQTPDLLERIKSVCRENKKVYGTIKIVVESNAFQQSIVQFLQRDGYSECEGKKSSEDKRTRLASVSYQIKVGSILFPRVGAEMLITQIVGLGAEIHDDLVDAFTLCAQKYVSFRPCWVGFV
jgi:predicted phage terminase large subunit-like protein